MFLWTGAQSSHKEREWEGKKKKEKKRKGGQGQKLVYYNFQLMISEKNTYHTEVADTVAEKK